MKFPSPAQITRVLRAEIRSVDRLIQVATDPSYTPMDAVYTQYLYRRKENLILELEAVKKEIYDERRKAYEQKFCRQSIRVAEPAGDSTSQSDAQEAIDDGRHIDQKPPGGSGEDGE